jgi:hypothetical protein
MGARWPAKGGFGAAGAGEGASGGFDQVAGTGSVTAHSLTPASASRTTGHDVAFGKGAATGWGKLSTPLPTRAWPSAGPVTPSPLRTYAPAVKEMSAADGARVLSRSHRSLSLLSDLCALGIGFRGPAERPAPPALLCRHSGMERRGAIHVSPSGVAKGRWVVLFFRRLVELVGFGNRLCGTARRLNSTPLPLGERAQICCLIEPIG